MWMRLEYLGHWDMKMQCIIEQLCSIVMWGNQDAVVVVEDTPESGTYIS